MTTEEVLKELKFWRDEMLVTEKAKEAFDIAIDCVEQVEVQSRQVTFDDILGLR